MDYITGALSTDVGGTLYTACKRLGLNGTKSVVIIGCGPMGSGGILMAKGFGAKVIAVDTDEKRLAMARELGADETLNPMKVDGVAGDNPSDRRPWCRCGDRDGRWQHSTEFCAELCACSGTGCTDCRVEQRDD